MFSIADTVQPLCKWVTQTRVRHSICSHAVDVSHRSLLREDVGDDKRDGHVGRGHCVAIL